jgi:hypothetical protein
LPGSDTFEETSNSFMKMICFLFLAIGATSSIFAQQNDKKEPEFPIGTWKLVAVENTLPDGSKTFPYGEDPKGMLVFDEHGNYAIQILKADRPKVHANDKNKATCDESAALVQGNNSHFGRYSLDKEKGVIRFSVDHAFYPNWEGTTQERSYSLDEEELRYIVTNTTNGGAVTALVVWKRKSKAH